MGVKFTEKEIQKAEKAMWEKFLHKDHISEEKKHGLLSISEISLALDSYDDIFSDFDPRPYVERALSVDFLEEAKRASREKPTGGLELKLLIPKAKRKISEENIIKRRLHEHFRKHYLIIQTELKKMKVKHLFGTVLGFTLVFVAVFFYYIEAPKLLSALVFTICEPAGWFTLWYNLDQIFYGKKSKKDDLDFYEKMSKCTITFIAY